MLLDAAAYVPTSRLDLQAVSPDFVCVSFYKMFGYPTGVGCLLARRSALAKLRRPWFAGGTVNFASVHGRAHILSPGEAGFEDGTLNYASIPAVSIGLSHLASGRHRCDSHACALSDGVAAPGARGAPALERPADGAHLRSHHDRDAGRHCDDELLRPRRPPAGLPARGGTGGRAGHLAAHRMLLQSGDRRGGRRHHGRGRDRGSPDRDRSEPAQVPPDDHDARRPECRGDPGVPRHRQQLRGRASDSSSSRPVFAIRRGSRWARYPSTSSHAE